MTPKKTGGTEPTITGRATWIYCGQRWNATTKRTYHLWVTDNEEQEQHVFDKPLIRAASIGSRYQVAETASGVLVGGEHAPKFIDRWDNPDQTDVWWSEDRGAQTHALAESRRKKAEDRNEFRAILAPVHKAYAKARTWQEKSAVLAAAMQAITDPRWEE